MTSGELPRSSFQLSRVQRELLAARRRAHGAEDAAAGERIPRRPAGEPLPLSFGQQRLWFLAQLAPASPAYNLTALFRLQGSLDAAALAATFAEIVRRHEVLRTTLPVVGRQPVQRVAPPPAPPLPKVDLRGLPGCAAAPEMMRVAGAEHRLAFDLARGPLLRLRLLRLAPASWALVVTLHHVVSDGWSIGVLAREVAALYAAFAAHRPSPLAELPIQYGDHALWRRGPEQAAQLAADLAYFRQRLAGAPMLLDLPVDRPRPAVPSDRGANLTTTLPAALTAALARLGHEQGTTLFMTLLAGYAVLLGRTSGQEDLVLGSAVAGRDRIELADLIGFFVNTLALRLDLAGAPSCRELLRRTREEVFGALAHQGAPFELLVQELVPVRRAGRTPIVQATLVLQNAPMPPLALGELTLIQVPVPVAAAHFELEVSVTETGDRLSCLWTYARELFDAATVRRWAGQWAVLLAAMASDARRPAGELPLMGAAERHQLVVEWNATTAVTAAAGGGRETCLHELVELQAAQSPDRVALVCEGRHLTYRELDRRANRLAHRLRRLGVGPEVRVGVAVERSLELLVGLLAALKSGGAYLPLDPSYPVERLAFMRGEARAPVLLTQQRLVGRLPAGEGHVLCLDAGDDDAAGDGGECPAGGALPDNLAYVVYTSGSTGRPKGVMVSHRAIVNRLRWMQGAYRLVAGEAVLQKTPTSLDVSVWELFWPLLAGARLVLARPGGHQDSAYLAGLVARERITTLHFVPAMLQVFLEGPRLRDCAGLRRVIASGEALPPELEARFHARFAEVSADADGAAGPVPGLHNLYGPTEAAVDVTAWACDGEGRRRGSVPIGRPISNLRVHLLDGAGAPVPPGVAGHLHIGGLGLARGYLGRPDLTAERFVPDGVGAAAGGERLYATGDLARRRADGVVEFLGRIDQRQVKVRGFRVELGECEAALARHPGVAACAVLLREDAPGDRRLVAYLVPRTASCPTGGELLAFLRQQLPDYMIPTAWVPLEQLPLTAGGKLDRGALPAPGAARPHLARAFAPPETELERRISAAWRQVLQLEQVGVDDNFFDLGGNSFRLFELQRSLLEATGREVPLIQLFQHTTIQALAAHLAAAETTVAETAAAETAAAAERASTAGRKVAMQERRRRRAGLLAAQDVEGR